MAVGGVHGPQGLRFEGAGGVGSPMPAEAAAPAQVSRTPLTSRPDPTRLSSGGARVARPTALTGKATDFLTNPAERDAYAFVTAAERPIDAVLDRLDALSPASYNRVLHAFGLTRGAAAGQTLLDALVGRGGSEPGKARLAERFFRQLEMKLAGQPGRILEHISPATRARLEAQPGWGRIAGLLGAR